MQRHESKTAPHVLLLAIALLLLGQLGSALHAHDLNLDTLDSDDCVICLLGSSDNPAVSKVNIQNTYTLTTQLIAWPKNPATITTPYFSLALLRAPPVFS